MRGGSRIGAWLRLEVMDEDGGDDEGGPRRGGWV